MGKNALMEAVITEDLERLKIFLDNKLVEVNMPIDKHSKKALHHAIYGRYIYVQ